jgi:hypothetical protein
MSRPGLSEAVTRWRKARDLQAVLGAVMFIVLGIGVVWFVKNHVGIKGDAVLICVLLLPALLYLAISGRLSEISGSGGVGAKFRATGALNVAPIVDRDGHIAGVIERVQLISTMLLAAAPQ